jgi:hypothetical protein
MSAIVARASCSSHHGLGAATLIVSGIQPTNCGVHKHGGGIGIVVTFPLRATAVRRSGEPCCQATHRWLLEFTRRDIRRMSRVFTCVPDASCLL